MSLLTAVMMLLGWQMAADAALLQRIRAMSVLTCVTMLLTGVMMLLTVVISLLTAVMMVGCRWLEMQRYFWRRSSPPSSGRVFMRVFVYKNILVDI